MHVCKGTMNSFKDHTQDRIMDLIQQSTPFKKIPLKVDQGYDEIFINVLT